MTPWTVACKAPLSMGFSRQEYWNGLPFPYPENLPDPGIEPRSPALQVDSLPNELLAPYFMENRGGERLKLVTDFLFLGSKITVDGACSNEIGRYFFLGRKAMTTLDKCV